MKVLVIGPSDTKSRGGMATVINGIRNSRILNNEYDIDVFASYIDGNIITRLMYSIWAYLKFLCCYKKYDLFHIHTAGYGSTFRKNCYLKVIKKAEKKAIVHIHAGKYMVFYKGLTEKKQKTVINFLKSADMVIALSEEWKVKFEEVFGITNCVSLDNAIDTEEYQKAVVYEEKYKNEFVFLGWLCEQKGVYDIVNAVDIAVKQNPEIKIYMAGGGEIDKVKSMVAQRKLQNNIEIVGWVDKNDKIKLLQKTATLLLPSYYEGLPMSVLEGMAAGKAIISTVVGAIPEVVTEKNGILIEPGDVQALADAIVKCSTDIHMLNTMSKENIKKINEVFSLKKVHIKLSEYYTKVINS